MGCCALGVVNSLIGLNGSRWHFIVDRGCSANNGFHGGNPLWVVNHFNNLDWHKLWVWIEMRWW